MLSEMRSEPKTRVDNIAMFPRHPAQTESPNFQLPTVKRTPATRKKRSTAQKAPKPRQHKVASSLLSDAQVDWSVSLGSLSTIDLEIRRLFTINLAVEHRQHVRLLTSVFFGVASRDALVQLCQAIATARSSSLSHLYAGAGDPLSLSRALDSLDNTTNLAHILRRYYLVELLKYRRKCEQLQQEQRLLRNRQKRHKHLRHDVARIELLRAGTLDIPETDSRPKTSLDKEGGRHRTDVTAVSDLMTALYPDLKVPGRRSESKDNTAYAQRRMQLRARLSCARNWYKIQERFGMGILALIPCGGEFDVSIEQ